MTPAHLMPSMMPGEWRGLEIIGHPPALHQPVTAFFAASAAPSDLILPTLDLTRCWPAATTMVSGFQSPIERAVLEMMLNRHATVLMVTPTAVQPDRLPFIQQEAMSAGRMILGWPAGAKAGRTTERLASDRNRHILGLARSVIVISGGTASRAYRVAREAAAARLRLLCHDHPAERDLALLGATAIGSLRDWQERLNEAGKAFD